jgi:hypothetical protein
VTEHADPTRGGHAEDNLTISEVVERFAAEGYDTSLVAVEGGTVREPASGAEADAGELAVHAYRRLEGVSDPADMVLVAAVDFPGGDVRGTLVLGYGPNAGPADGDVLLLLPVD